MSQLEINVIPFKFKHLPLLLEMHKSQGYLHLSDINMRTLPKTGYIALMNNQPIAAGFLRRLEPCYAQLDTLVSNAYFGSKIRHEGVKKVVDALLDEAKRLKLEGILAITTDEGILKRAKELGFHTLPQTLIGLPIK